MKDTFILYTKWKTHLELLDDAQRGRLLTVLFAYAADEPLPEMDPATAMLFSVMRIKLDQNAERFEARCEAQKQNGAKGGRPPKSTKPAETQNNPTKPMGFSENPTKHDHDYDYDLSDDDDDAEDAYTCGGARAHEGPLETDVEQAEWADADRTVRAAYRDAYGHNPTNEEVRHLSRTAVLRGKAPLIGEAIRRAALHGAKSVGKYVARIVDEWDMQGIETIAELEEYDALCAIASGEIAGQYMDADGALAQIAANRAAKKAAGKRGLPGPSP